MIASIGIIVICGIVAVYAGAAVALILEARKDLNSNWKPDEDE